MIGEAILQSTTLADVPNLILKKLVQMKPRQSQEQLPDLQKMNEFIVNKSYGWELLELWAKPLTNDDSAETESLTIEKKIENHQEE